MAGNGLCEPANSWLKLTEKSFFQGAATGAGSALEIM